MLIALSGKLRAGKDSFADGFIKSWGENAKKFYIVQKLKEFARDYFGVPWEAMWENKTEESRRIMQGLGTMMREEVDEFFWLNNLLKDPKFIKYVSSKDMVAIVPDLRFPTEAESFKRLNGILIRLVREGQFESDKAVAHITETALDGYEGFDLKLKSITVPQLHQMADSLSTAMKDDDFCHSKKYIKKSLSTIFPEWVI